MTLNDYIPYSIAPRYHVREEPRTFVGMELQKKFCEEACRTHWDKGRRRGVAPKKVGQSRQKYGSDVVRYDERKAQEVRLIRGKDIRNVPSVGADLDAVVQFSQETDGFFSAVATDAGWSVKKEVVPRISRGDSTVVEKSDVADPWQHEIFQDGSCSGTGTDDQNARRFQSRLARRSPESVDVIQFPVGSRMGLG